MEKKPVVLQVPHLPTLHAADTDENDGDNDDESGSNKVQPININLLKEFMHKKVQKGMHEKKRNNFMEKNNNPPSGSASYH
jgi:hypothetical protein